MPKVSRLEVIASGARRRWTEEEKRRIVAESFDGPRRVFRRRRGDMGFRRRNCSHGFGKLCLLRRRRKLRRRYRLFRLHQNEHSGPKSPPLVPLNHFYRPLRINAAVKERRMLPRHRAPGKPTIDIRTTLNTPLTHGTQEFFQLTNIANVDVAIIITILNVVS